MLNMFSLFSRQICTTFSFIQVRLSIGTIDTIQNIFTSNIYNQRLLIKSKIGLSFSKYVGKYNSKRQNKFMGNRSCSQL